MIELVFHRRAARYYQRLPMNVKELLKAKFELLRKDPNNFPGVIKMAGSWSNHFRFRSGDLRIIFKYNSDSTRIYVNYIGPRGGIYKK